MGTGAQAVVAFMVVRPTSTKWTKNLHSQLKKRKCLNFRLVHSRIRLVNRDVELIAELFFIISLRAAMNRSYGYSSVCRYGSVGAVYLIMNDSDILLVDNLCTALFGPDAEARKRADQQLSPLCRVEGINQLRCVMEKSNNSMAHYFVSATLLRLITDSWNTFTVEQRIDLRQWLFNVIGNKAPTMERHNVNTLILVLCRLTKLGWLDHQVHQELPANVNNFFLSSSTPAHVVTGLNILNALITEINQVSSRHTLTQHRKTSVSFRDACLFDIFKTSLMTLQNIRANPAQTDPRMCEQGLFLALACLSFDFVGIFPDESSDEVGTVQIPTTWRSVMLDQNTMQLFWDLYATLPPPRSTDCLKCIVQFASVRRSLFSADEERKAWLQHILSGILNILQKKQGLDDADNYYEFCRYPSSCK